MAQPLRVCAKCGAISPTEAPSCKGCGSDPVNVALAPPRGDGAMFAMILESDFQCRGCGLRSSLDSLYVDAEVDCHRCGMSQIFDVDQWKNGLAHAHSVADLSGPDPQGQGFALHGKALRGENPFGALGVKFTFAELTESGMTISSKGMLQQTLRVKVAAGHPVCPEGHGPMTVDLAPPRVTVRCATCNKPATYVLPPRTAELDADCCGVIDDEHREDRKLAQMQPSAGGGGAVALTCPTCNASLPATADSSVVTCQFCSTTSYVPRRAFLKLHPQQKSRPFWLLFKGPSAKRTGKSDDDDDEDDPPADRAPATATSTATAPGNPTPTATAMPYATGPTPSRAPVLVIALVAAVVAIAGIGAFVALSADSKPKSAPASHATPAPAPHKPGHH